MRSARSAAYTADAEFVEALPDVPELAKQTRKSADWHGGALTATPTSIYVSWMLDHGKQTDL
jgi:hypothetical protein